MGACSGICWAPGPGSALKSHGTTNPDCPAGRESRFLPALFVSRGTGTGTEVCGTSGNGKNFCGTVTHGCSTGQAGPGRKIAGLCCPVPCSSLYYIVIYFIDRYIYQNPLSKIVIISFVRIALDFFLAELIEIKKSGPLRSHFDLKRKNKNSISYVNWKWEKLCLTFLENGNTYETPTLSLYRSLFQTIIIF